MRRRMPKGLRKEYADQAVRLGYTRKTAKELFAGWVHDEKRRTHKRERREGRQSISSEMF